MSKTYLRFQVARAKVLRCVIINPSSMAEISRQQETIKYHETYLEDVYDGIISLDRMLKLIRASERDAMVALSRGQMINVASYIAGRVACEFDDLQKVKGHLPDDAQRQLVEYHQRFNKQHQKVTRLKLLG